jgi:hypothetical protein
MSRALAAVAISIAISITPAAVSADAPAADVEAVICSYDWDCETALGFAWRESRYQPAVINYDCDSRHPGTLRCFGTFQLAEGDCGLTDEEMLDLRQNVRCAYEMWRMRSWEPWGGN